MAPKPKTEEIPIPQASDEPYFGSVAFFKHIILGVVFLMIFVPVMCCLILMVKNRQLKQAMNAYWQEAQAALPAEAEATDEQQAFFAETPDYTSLYPDMVLPQPARNTVQEQNIVYLTFDDGPSRLTEQVLDILAEYDVKATFFAVPKEDETSANRMRRVVDEGHTLAMHSYEHDYAKMYASVENYLDDIHHAYEIIHEATGIYPQVFRFAGGSMNAYNSAIHQELISEMLRRGFVYFDWNATAGDATTRVPSPETLAASALKAAGQYSRVVLLMHDSAGKDNLLEALPQIIEGYREAGYTFAPLTPEVTPVVFSYTD